MSSSEWKPTSAFLQRIYSGYRAEQKYRKMQQSWGEELAHNQEIPQKDIPKLTRKALDAAINTLRRTEDPNPDLLERMILDQAFLYRIQHKIQHKQDDPIHKKLKAIAKAYTRKNMGLFFRDNLNFNQEAVYEKATNDFLMKIQDPNFKLTSSLITYLIGILKRQIYASNRPKTRLTSFSEDPAEDQEFPVEILQYFQRTHRVITQHLGRMGAICQQLILRYYRIDLARASAVADLPDVEQPLTEAEIRARFAIGMGPPASPENLKILGKEIGIDPRQASRKHRECLNELVLKVTTQLFTKPIPDSLKATLQARVEEARKKRKG